MTSPLQANICAVIVTYHPDDALGERVKAIATQAGGVVIVDNGSGTETQARIHSLSLPCPFHCILNVENRGIATALNQGIEWARSQGYAWALTFDQDSSVSTDFTERLVQVYEQYPDKDQLAIVGANFTHAEQNLSGYPASDLTYGSGNGWHEVVMAITSGGLMSLSAHTQIGPFVDALFIDHVDTEYCLRARSKGYHIIVTDAPLMEHSVGQLTPRRLLGRQAWTFNYSSGRWYYRTRNHIYLLRRYLRQEPRWLGRTVSDLLRGWLKLLLFETGKVGKVASVLRGLWHGMFFRQGRSPIMTLSPERASEDAANLFHAARTKRAPWLYRGIPLLCFAVLAALVFHYAVAVPILDQWALVSLLEKWHGHTLKFADFWAQHNEHRLIFPRLLMLACAILSGWDLRWELAVNLLLGAGIYAALAYQTRQTARQAELPAFRWLAPVLAIAVFSFRQFENWEWGWQLQIFLNVLSVVCGIVALAGRPFSWLRLGAGMACGIVATYSFANGMLFWIVGASMVFCLPRSPRKLLYLAAWLVMASATIASYRWQFADNPIMRESLTYGLHHPIAFVLYAVTYLGSLFSIGNLESRPYWSMAVAATPAGLFGLLALCRVARHCRMKRINSQLLLPYGAMVLYACLSALVSASGRVSMGVVQSTSSRYTTISQLFWAGLLALALLAAESVNTNADSQPASKMESVPEWQGVSVPGKRLLLVAGVALAFFSVASMPRLKRHYEAIGEAERELKNNSTHPIHLHELHPNSDYLRQQQTTLQHLRLNMYQEPKRELR